MNPTLHALLDAALVPAPPPRDDPPPELSACPPLPAAAQLDPALAEGASPWLDAYIAFSRRWLPRAYDGFHEAAGLWVLSTAAAGRVMLHFGGQRFTSLYILLCTRTSLYTKSTTAEIGLQTLKAAGLDWLLTADSMTLQKFIRDLATHVPEDYGELTPSQRERVHARLALAHRLVVITGAPGVGKTTVLRTICNILQAHGVSLTLCAPTGKAARRMTEATGLPAATIHRTLGIFGDEEAKYSFQADGVTIDEASMITAALMHRIVKACGARTRLIFVGDVDQLPPVDAGEPFFQLIHSGVVPVARLTVIHRQGKDNGAVGSQRQRRAQDGCPAQGRGR